MSSISEFMDEHFLHFNARETVAAARAWKELLAGGGKMFLSMAGAMSTAELGRSLGEMIRQDKVHAICCTGANIEEDLFNLFSHNDYVMVPNYRDLSPADEEKLYEKSLNRVTDTCIPETVMRQIQDRMYELWKKNAEQKTSKFHYELVYELMNDRTLAEHYHIPAKNSWVLAAKEKNLPIYTPGWEDSTLGNIFCAEVMKGRLPGHGVVRSGTEQLEALAKWYLNKAEQEQPVGFFQIGGGIAGDFSICVVPMLIQDLKKDDTPFWAYFCQISDSTTSYGSYSGAIPNEKITWGKLDVQTPKFVIESDAAVIAPLIFAYVLGY